MRTDVNVRKNNFMKIINPLSDRLIVILIFAVLLSTMYSVIPSGIISYVVFCIVLYRVIALSSVDNKKYIHRIASFCFWIFAIGPLFNFLFSLIMAYMMVNIQGNINDFSSAVSKNYILKNTILWSAIIKGISGGFIIYYVMKNISKGRLLSWSLIGVICLSVLNNAFDINSHIVSVFPNVGHVIMYCYTLFFIPFMDIGFIILGNNFIRKVKANMEAGHT